MAGEQRELRGHWLALKLLCGVLSLFLATTDMDTRPFPQGLSLFFLKKKTNPFSASTIIRYSEKRQQLTRNRTSLAVDIIHLSLSRDDINRPFHFSFCFFCFSQIVMATLFNYTHTHRVISTLSWLNACRITFWLRALRSDTHAHIRVIHPGTRNWKRRS